MQDTGAGEKIPKHLDRRRASCIFRGRKMLALRGEIKYKYNKSKAKIKCNRMNIIHKVNNRTCSMITLATNNMPYNIFKIFAKNACKYINTII
jgi:hypothetical protein